MHSGEHAFGACRTVNHQHAHAVFRRHLMRHAGRNMDARTFPRVEQFIANLEIRAAFENVKRFVGLDVIVRTRLKSGFAILFHHLERLRGVVAGNLHDDFVGLGVDVSRARR